MFGREKRDPSFEGVPFFADRVFVKNSSCPVREKRDPPNFPNQLYIPVQYTVQALTVGSALTSSPVQSAAAALGSARAVTCV